MTGGRAAKTHVTAHRPLTTLFKGAGVHAWRDDVALAWMT